MKIIAGDRIQERCDISISKLEHKEHESRLLTDSIDIDSYDFSNYDNPNKIYVNSSLINFSKPVLAQSKLFEKLKEFKNPFDLVLHNSDQPFDEQYLKYFEIQNLNRIFTQNVNVVHKDVIPIPIGIANDVWPYGDQEGFKKKLNNIKEKTNFIYFNFRVEGGVRGEHRPQCYKAGLEKGLEYNKTLSFLDYIDELSTYKYCLSPEGNGIDCHRMWECLYLKVIPICGRNILTEYFSKIFPIVLIDDWDNLDLNFLEKNYDNYSNWENYNLLDLDSFLQYVKFYD